VVPLGEENGMRKIGYGLVVLSMTVCLATAARAEVDVSIGIGLPHVNIGINLPYFPEFYPVPGYPVYYAPQVYANYFFYDGMYWVYQDDNWYASYWFNGPWELVEPEFVPLFILRVPVFYYVRPPAYFRGWHLRRPPRWGEHWGHDWERRHRDWDRWDRHAAPPLAPLPTYQREYSGDRYPSEERQHELHNRHYRYQPHDRSVREHLQPREHREEPVMKGKRPPESRYARPPEPGLPPHRNVEGRQPQPPIRDREPVLRDRRHPSRDEQPGRESPSPGRRDQRGGSQERGERRDFDRDQGHRSGRE
jgi:hypothetical protein